MRQPTPTWHYGLIALSWAVVFWASYAVTLNILPANPPAQGPESAPAGDPEAAPAVLEGQEEAAGVCLLEVGEGRQAEGRQAVVVLTLTVEPEPAQRHETATTEVVGACAASAADRGDW